tara:strand:+ start:32 stop:244 length:213 start_codon:yes stop_codon:yes gene_type:complete
MFQKSRMKRLILKIISIYINLLIKIIIVGQYHSHVLQILILKLRKNLIMLFFINKKVNALKGYNLVLLTM